MSLWSAGIGRTNQRDIRDFTANLINRFHPKVNELAKVKMDVMKGNTKRPHEAARNVKEDGAQTEHPGNTVINRGLLLGAVGAAVGGSYLLIKNPPEINKLVITAEKIWNKMAALKTLPRVGAASQI